MSGTSLTPDLAVRIAVVMCRLVDLSVRVQSRSTTRGQRLRFTEAAMTVIVALSDPIAHSDGLEKAISELERIDLEISEQNIERNRDREFGEWFRAVTLNTAADVLLQPLMDELLNLIVSESERLLHVQRDPNEDFDEERQELARLTGWIESLDRISALSTRRRLMV